MELVLFFSMGTILLVSLLIGWNAIYIRTPYYQNQICSIKKFQAGVPDNLTILNTGSNHAFFAIDWSIVGVRGFSLASGPQPLSWDFRLWKKYCTHLKQDGIAVFVLSDLVFGFLEYPNARSDYRYYYFLSSKEIPRYTWWQAVKYRYIPVTENWHNFVRCFYHRGMPFREHKPSLAYAEEQAELRIAGWKEDFSLSDLQHRESAIHLHGLICQSTAVLREMVDDAYEKGYRPVLMVPPLSAVINSKIAPEFLDEVLYLPIREKFSDVPLLDYLHDERFQDYRLYQNGDFMNEAGRRAFMPVLWKDIQMCTGRDKA